MHECEEDYDLSPFNVPLFKFQPCSLEKVKKKNCVVRAQLWATSIHFWLYSR